MFVVLKGRSISFRDKVCQRLNVRAFLYILFFIFFSCHGFPLQTVLYVTRNLVMVLLLKTRTVTRVTVSAFHYAASPT